MLRRKGQRPGRCLGKPLTLGSAVALLVPVLVVLAGSGASASPQAAPKGDWGIVTSPNTGASQNNYLVGLECVSASDCWAVGDYRAGNTYQTLVEHWDGTSWTIVPSPNTSSTRNNRLFGVTCASPSDCWAVGFHVSSNGSRTLIMRWDGSAWAIVTSPNAIASDASSLHGVTCVSASDCWAVGDSYSSLTGFVAQTLIMHWDGTSWSVDHTSSSLPVAHNTLLGVTCVSGSDCWAVGSSFTGGVVQTLIERWDGTSWSVVPSSNTSATEHNVLHAVSCSSGSDCWAVGFYLASTPQTLIERWDGASWSIVTSPNTNVAQNNVLHGVTCVAESQCWAVGRYRSDSTYQTLVEFWDGISWTIVASPNTSAARANSLLGVACVATSDCWAVGNARGGSADQTLTMKYSVGPAPLEASELSFTRALRSPGSTRIRHFSRRASPTLTAILSKRQS